MQQSMSLQRVFAALIMLESIPHKDVIAAVAPRVINVQKRERRMRLFEFLNASKGDYPRFFIMLSDQERINFTAYLNKVADKYEGTPANKGTV